MDRTDARDPASFVATAGPSLHPVARALTGGQPAADELVDTVLSMVARRWHRIGADPTAYAHRLLYREYAGRRGPSAPTLTSTATRPARPTDAGAPARPPSQAALDQLEPRPRSLLVLRYLQRRTDAEAAELLGTSPGAVAEEIVAALAQMQALLSEAAPAGAESTTADVEADIRTALRGLADGTALDPPTQTAPPGTPERPGLPHTWYLLTPNDHAVSPTDHTATRLSAAPNRSPLPR